MSKFNYFSSTKVPSSEHDFYFITVSFERLKKDRLSGNMVDKNPKIEKNRKPIILSNYKKKLKLKFRKVWTKENEL